MADERYRGTVKWFNATKGFGFITPDSGTEDLFVHQTSIQADGFRSLREGETVEYAVITGEDGRTKAVQVTGPDGAQPLGTSQQREYDHPGSRGQGGGGGGGHGGYGSHGRGYR